MLCGVLHGTWTPLPHTTTHPEPACLQLFSPESVHVRGMYVGAGGAPGQAAMVHAATSCHFNLCHAEKFSSSPANAQALCTTQYSAQHMRRIASRSVYLCILPGLLGSASVWLAGGQCRMQGSVLLTWRSNIGPAGSMLRPEGQANEKEPTAFIFHMELPVAGVKRGASPIPTASSPLCG